MLLGGATVVGPAHAQSSATEPATTEQVQGVKTLVAKGAAAYRKNDFKSARAAFAEAWSVYPYASVALSLADVEMRLGRYLEAARHWEFYLASDPPETEQAKAQLAECRKHLGSLRLEVEPRDADVVLDGADLDHEPPPWLLWLEPGTHTLFGRYMGRISEGHSLDVAAGVEHHFTLSLPSPPPLLGPTVPPPQTETAAPRREPVPSSRGSSTRTVVVAGGGVLTAAAFTVAIVSGLQAQAVDRRRLTLLADLHRAEPDYVPQNGLCWVGRPDRPALCTELDSEIDTHQSSVKRANAFYLTGGIVGAVTVATFLLWPSSNKAAQATGLTLSPLPIAGSRGLQLGTTF